MTTNNTVSANNNTNAAFNLLTEYRSEFSSMLLDCCKLPDCSDEYHQKAADIQTYMYSISARSSAEDALDIFFIYSEIILGYCGYKNLVEGHDVVSLFEETEQYAYDFSVSNLSIKQKYFQADFFEKAHYNIERPEDEGVSNDLEYPGEELEYPEYPEAAYETSDQQIESTPVTQPEVQESSVPFSEIVNFDKWDDLEAIFKVFPFLTWYQEHKILDHAGVMMNDYEEREFRKEVFGPQLSRWMSTVATVYPFTSDELHIREPRAVIYSRAKKAANIVIASVRDGKTFEITKNEFNHAISKAEEAGRIKAKASSKSRPILKNQHKNNNFPELIFD
jgi:hypothetical protein